MLPKHFVYNYRGNKRSIPATAEILVLQDPVQFEQGIMLRTGDLHQRRGSIPIGRGGGRGGARGVWLRTKGAEKAEVSRVRIEGGIS